MTMSTGEEPRNPGSLKDFCEGEHLDWKSHEGLNRHMAAVGLFMDQLASYHGMTPAEVHAMQHVRSSVETTVETPELASA